MWSGGIQGAMPEAWEGRAEEGYYYCLCPRGSGKAFGEATLES